MSVVKTKYSIIYVIYIVRNRVCRKNEIRYDLHFKKS